MHVGLDFDNTIVSYDALFHKVAREGGLIPDGTPISKLSVRDHLREVGKEEVWTEMQGTVYGGRMAEASAFPGVMETLRWVRSAGVRISIVSHKTRYPYLGTRYDLHAAARDWIAQSLRDERGPLVASGDVYFEVTIEEKIARIAAIGCNLYLDDLPEILLAPGFPTEVERLLFDPDAHHSETELQRVADWDAVRAALVARWQPTR